MFPQTLGVADPTQQAYAPTGYMVPPELQAQLDAIQKRRMAPPQAQFTPEQIAQRRDENERQYSLGILGGMASDEGLQGVGGTVLKQALANRQAKISERGTTDPLSGQFTYSPDYLAQRDDSAEAAVQQRIAQGRTQWDQQRAQAADKRDLQTQRAQDQRDLRQLIAATRAPAGDGPGKGDKDRWTVEDRMADDYRNETKPSHAILQSFNALQATAQRTDAPSDIAFIYQYMKMLDPTSVVREGEFATAQNATGIPDQVRNMYNKAMSGQRLNIQQRTQMLGTAQRLAQQADDQLGGLNDQYTEKAKRRGLDPENIITGRRMTPPAGAAPLVIDVGAALRRPAPRQALPQANPQSNELRTGSW
jgi:hypothetical protein